MCFIIEKFEWKLCKTHEGSRNDLLTHQKKKKNIIMHSKDENHIFFISSRPSIYPLSSINSLQKNSTLPIFFLFLIHFDKVTRQSDCRESSPRVESCSRTSAAPLESRRPLSSGMKRETTQQKRGGRLGDLLRSVSPSGRPPLAPQRMTRHVTQAGPPTWRGLLKKRKKKKREKPDSSNSILA